MIKRNQFLFLLIPLLLWVRRHYFLTAVVVLGIFMYATWDESPSAPQRAASSIPGPYEVQEEKTAAAPAKAEGPAPAVPPGPQQVADGNALFARNLLATLPEEQYKQYGKQFYLAMLQSEPGEQRQWKVNGAYGTITPGERFKGSYGKPCREYEEVYTVQNKSQRRAGVACQNEQGGWCKLRRGSTPNCALSEDGGMFGGMSVQWHNTKMGWERFKYGLKNMF